MNSMNMHEPLLQDHRGLDARPDEPSIGTDFLRVLRRRYRAILATIALVLGIAVIALLVIEPRYQATAVMRVDTDDLEISGDDPASPTSIRDLELRRTHQIETQIQLLNSRSVARQVVRDLALFDDPEFNPAAGTPLPGSSKSARAGTQAVAVPPQLIEKVTDRLQAAVNVDQDGQTSFINVTATSGNPAKAARIANKVTAAYIDIQITERRAAQRRVAEALGRRVEELRQQLLATNWSIASYRSSHNIDPGPGSDANSAQMSRLASELAAARAARAEASARSGGAGAGGQLMSSLLADLRSQESSTSQRLAQLLTLYGRAHPDVQKADAELAQVRRGIEAETARLRQQFSNDVTAQNAREATLSGDLGSMRSQSLARGMMSVPLLDLERNATATQAIYLSLLSRLKQTLRQSDLVKADATVASPALSPTQPSFPRPAPILGAALAAAVIFSLILVLIAEATDNHVRTASQVYALTGLPTFGLIPEISRRKRLAAHVAVISRPYTVFAEAVRTVEGKLARLLPKPTGNVVVVTSPLPDDGKTTVAIALAAAAVATFRSAIVVDFDLRQPGLDDLIDPAGDERDLLDYLRGEATLDQIIISSATSPGLKAIFVRNALADPGAVLASPQIKTLLDELQARFDQVIVVTPPVLAAGDARSVSRYADAVLLVLRWGKTTPDLVQSTLMQFDGEVTGVVFNRVNYAKHARLACGDGLQYYSKFKSYYAPGPTVALPSIARS
ncbi:MAG: polysaccharide biosynthesis tyrosine autokinase [Sphingomonas sp.]